MSKGLFITFEGTEGAGKSTLMKALAAELTLSLGKNRVVATREPGGSKVSEQIRKTILDYSMNPWTELFLYEAARAEHLNTRVEPALAEGKIVLCDRFTDSTLAYQSTARGLPWNAVEELNRIVTQGRVPDLTVFLDIDPALGLKRAQVQTRFEKEGVKFQSKVRQGFLKARRKAPSRWLTLKAMSGTPEDLAAQVIQRLFDDKKIPLPKKAHRRG